MIALLLATQITAAALPQGLPLDAVPPVHGMPTHVRPIEILRTLPNKGCGAGLGRLEVSMAEPTALLRKGDRPAKTLRHWADYPDPRICLVAEAAP